MSGRRKTLERERLRLEKLLSQHPHWRMMRQVGGRATLVDGAWRFDGLGPAQASALRESLVFRAYQDVLMGLARLDAEARGIASAPTNRSAIPQSHDRARAEMPEAVPEALPHQAAAAPKGASEALGDASTEASGEASSGEALGETPTLMFRTKVEIKPVGGTARVFSGETPQAAEPAVEPAQSAAVPSEAADDLTRIRAINRALAQALIAAGVTSFRQIANWNSRDVRRIARDLDLDKRIWRENWIEQAALLAGRDEAAAKRSDSAPVPIPAAVSAPVVPDGGRDGSSCNAVAGVVPPEGDGPEEPTAIGNGLAPAQTEERDTAEAETTGAQALPPGFADIADGRDAPEAPAPPATEAAESLGREGRVAPAEPVEPAVASLEGEAGNDNTAPVPAVAVGPWGESIKAGRRPRRLPPPPLRRLTYIRGITEEIAERLRLSGVHSLEEIAAWWQSDVQWFQAILGDGARISADQWIEQAELLASGRWTRHALLLDQGQMPATLVRRPEPVVARRRLAWAGSVAARAGAGPATGDDAAQARTRAFMRAGTVAAREAITSGPLEARVPIAPGTSSARADEVAPLARSGGPAVSGAMADEASAAPAPPAPEVSDDVRPVQAASGSQSATAGGAAQDRAGIRPDAVSDIEDATSKEGGGQSALVEEATPLVVKPSDVARSTVVLVADDLVGRMTPEAAPPGREPERDRDILDPALSGEAGPTTNSKDGAADALDPLDDVVSRTSDSGMSAPAAVDSAMTDAVVEVDAEARSAAADAIDEAGTSDPQDRPEPELAVGALDPADDFEDAEVLVSRRKPAAEAEPGRDAAGEVVASSATGRAGALEASDGGRRAEAETARRKGSSAEADGDEFTPLGDEATVRIVSRQGPPGERSGDAAEPAKDPGAEERLGEDEVSRAAENGGRERLGYSPEYIARRMDVRDHEDDRDGYAGYRDAVEEATVTIIRAKGREEPASAVVPDQIANDQGGSPEEADRARGDQQPKKRALGSRFLRALTGE